MSIMTDLERNKWFHISSVVKEEDQPYALTAGWMLVVHFREVPLNTEEVEECDHFSVAQRLVTLPCMQGTGFEPQ